ncbi:hypothetical protein FRC14_006677 [Serendipita sp. 396]|nr:hypothetical protein FRC14_006677 [Serendipita sp. 396]
MLPFADHAFPTKGARFGKEVVQLFPSSAAAVVSSVVQPSAIETVSAWLQFAKLTDIINQQFSLEDPKL